MEKTCFDEARSPLGKRHHGTDAMSSSSLASTCSYLEDEGDKATHVLQIVGQDSGSVVVCLVTASAKVGHRAASEKRHPRS
jgi:hypothetical protein